MGNKELLEMAKRANSVEEFFALTKESNVELTQKQAEDYFERINKWEELSDDALDNVAGGAAYDNEEWPVITLNSFCEHWTCLCCRSGDIDEHLGGIARHTCEVNPEWRIKPKCRNCIFPVSNGNGQWRCSRPDRQK